MDEKIFWDVEALGDGRTVGSLLGTNFVASEQLLDRLSVGWNVLIGVALSRQ
jgi:hypothetical protein